MEKKGKKKKNEGINLIVLVITIVVIIIIAGAVILNISNNNPITEARKARFLSDIDTFKSELSMYKLSKQENQMGNYDGTKLYADKISVTDDGVKSTSRNITNVITSMKNTKYIDKFEVKGGELVYIGASKEETNWCSGIIEATNFQIDIETVPNINSISGKVILKGALVETNKIEWCKVYIKRLTDSEYPEIEQYKSIEKENEISYNISGLQSNTEYIVKVEIKMIDEVDTRSKEIGKIRTIIDNVPPQKPSITVPNELNKYEIEGITVTLNDNDGGSGINENECKYIVNKVSTTYDKENSIWNTANKIENIISGNAEITYTVSSDGEYYVHILAVDNAGNKIVGKSEKIIIDTIAPDVEGIVSKLEPNDWTNGEVKVTLANLPSDAVIVEYTLTNSTTWQIYNKDIGIRVTQNGDGSIRVKDTLGNVVTKTYTVDRIDKDVPSNATFTPNTASNVERIEVSVSAEDAIATGTNNKSGIASIKYQWTTSNIGINKDDSSWNTASEISNNGIVTLDTVVGTRYLQVLIIDNAGNKRVFVSGSYVFNNSITTNDIVSNPKEYYGAEVVNYTTGNSTVAG